MSTSTAAWLDGNYHSPKTELNVTAGVPHSAGLIVLSWNEHQR
jgi:hypothetical protein